MARSPRDRRILVTGGAGFIGSHLTDALVGENEVTVLDNLSTGNRAWVSPRARFIQGDVRDADALRQALEGVEVVFHQAALPSVPRSFLDPLATHEVNATGTLRLLEAARKAGVERFVYAASSSAYGDVEELPKREAMPPAPLSPYAVSKLAGEQYVRVYALTYGLRAASLRYFNVYGPRQDPHSQYAAVVPRFVTAALQRRPLIVYGDGRQSRDFTFIQDAVRANLLAAQADVSGEVLNVAGGRRTTILELARLVEELVGHPLTVHHEAARPGDILHSLADLAAARRVLGFEPQTSLRDGLAQTVAFHKEAPQTPTGLRP